MLSKFLRLAARCPPVMLNKKFRKPSAISARVMSQMVPPNQYDMPWSKRFSFIYVVRVYWETVPLFSATAFALCIMFYSIYNACINKVDVVFSARSRRNISRTMNLRDPSIHKMFIIHQRYDPWPEMQDVLDKMVSAEKRALIRAQTCIGP